MRRALALISVAAALLFLLPPGTAAATPIPGTPIQILELEPTTKTISLGAQTNFSWAVFNGGPRYDLTVAANSSDSDFLLEVSPSTFTLGQDNLARLSNELLAGGVQRRPPVRSHGGGKFIRFRFLARGFPLHLHSRAG